MVYDFDDLRRALKPDARGAAPAAIWQRFAVCCMMAPMTEKLTEVPQDNPPTVSRRTMLVAGAAATLAGLGAAWWGAQPTKASNTVSEPVEGFWALQWDAPQGGLVRLSEFRGRPLMINFWATWCPPCVEELPLINAFFEKNKANGWQVLGLAVDKPVAVQSFLQKLPLHFPVALAGLSGQSWGAISEIWQVVCLLASR